MRIKLSEEAYNLVSSLSRTEKAYFKKQTLSSKESILITAFDVLNAASKYDEQSINQKLKEKGITPDSVYKRLIPAILKMLEQYHHSGNTRLTLTSIFNSIDILFSKNLLSLCKIQLDKGLRIARETKEYNFEALFLFLRQNLKARGMKLEIETNEQFHHEIMSAIDNLRTNTIYDYLTLRSGELKRTYDTTAEGREKVLKEILQHEIFNQEPRDGYYISHYSLLASAYFSLGKWEEAELICEEILAHSFNLDELSDKNFIKVVTLMFNVVIIYLLLRKSDKVKKIMPKLKVELERERLKVRGNYHLAYSFNYELVALNHLILSGQLKEALKMTKTLASDYESLLKKAPDNAYHILTTEVYIYFLSTEYSKAISLANKLMVDELKRQKFDLEVTRWLELLSHYNSSDKALFESRWLAQSRHIKNSNSGYKWEVMVLKTLKETFSSTSKRKQEVFTQLFQELAENQKEEIRTRLQGLDILTWIESIALSKPMAILLKERYLEQSPTSESQF